MVQEKLAVPYNGEHSVKNYDWNAFVFEYHNELLN